MERVDVSKVRKIWKEENAGFPIIENDRSQLLQAKAWADNLFCFGEHLGKTIRMAQQWGDAILRLWGATIKKKSRMAICAREEERKQAVKDHPGWKVGAKMVILGAMVETSCSTNEEAYKTLRNSEKLCS